MLAAVRAAARKHGAWSVERRELAAAVKAANELVALLEGKVPCGRGTKAKRARS